MWGRELPYIKLGVSNSDFDPLVEDRLYLSPCSRLWGDSERPLCARQLTTPDFAGTLVSAE